MNASRGTVLVVGHVVPHPPSAGNEVRVRKLIARLRSRGFAVVLLLNHPGMTDEALAALKPVAEAVHFVHEPPERLPRCVPRDRLRRLRRAWYRLLPASLFPLLHGTDRARKLRADAAKRVLASERLVRMTGHLAARYRPCAVIAEYAFAAPCLRAVPQGVLRLVDTHDVFSSKAERVLAYGIDDPLACTRREERKLLRHADVVIAIQSDEARLLAEMVPGRRVITVGVDFEAVPPGEDGVVPGRVLVVGSGNPLNVHGLTRFLERAWPIVRAGSPEAALRVAGALASGIPGDVPGVERVGWVPDLGAEYRRAAVVINPTEAGTGLKIKSVEALCHARPLVATPHAVLGIDAAEPLPFVVSPPGQAFGAAVLRLLRSPAERQRLAHAAWTYARTAFAADTVYAPLEEVLP